MSLVEQAKYKPKNIYGIEWDDPIADGLISPWREGNRLYLFAGKYLHVMNLPVEDKP